MNGLINIIIIDLPSWPLRFCLDNNNVKKNCKLSEVDQNTITDNSAPLKPEEWEAIDSSPPKVY
jgi:hypothetical protein